MAFFYYLLLNDNFPGKLELGYVQDVIQKLVSQGNAEWEGREKTRCLIIWRTPDEWADLIYKWVRLHFDPCLCTSTSLVLASLVHLHP